jgi:hypothetical protein
VQAYTNFEALLAMPVMTRQKDFKWIFLKRVTRLISLIIVLVAVFKAGEAITPRCHNFSRGETI